MNLIHVESPHYATHEEKGKTQPTLTRKSSILLFDSGGRSTKEILTIFLDKESKESAHFVIDQDGTTYQTIPEEYVALHHEDSTSLGVLISNETILTDKQIEALMALCTIFCIRYHIPLNRVVGDVADFPWYEFLNALGANVADGELRE